MSDLDATLLCTFLLHLDRILINASCLSNNISWFVIVILRLSYACPCFCLPQLLELAQREFPLSECWRVLSVWVVVSGQSNKREATPRHKCLHQGHFISEWLFVLRAIKADGAHQFIIRLRWNKERYAQHATEHSTIRLNGQTDKLVADGGYGAP